jgi:hypothetical protein
MKTGLMREVALEIAGLGILLYSPPAVAHIPVGSNYLQEHFWHPADVARHVMSGELTAFATGSPGAFRLRVLGGPLDDERVGSTDFKLRLGLQVRDGTLCVRDLYDLQDWSPECPAKQQVAVLDGWYRLTVFSALPASGLLGDDQLIEVHLEPADGMPSLRWDGVPELCG